MFPAFLYPLLSFIPVGILATILKTWRWWEDAKGLRAPAREKLLRAAGEAARRQKEDLDDRILDAMVWVLGFPPVLIVCYLAFSRKTAGPPSMFWAFALVAAVAAYGRCLLKLTGLLEKRAESRLKLRGKKAMGEELNRLMADGCNVFHDVPLDQKGCIDHVIVSCAGVFAIETTTRRKGESAGNQKAHEVIYDGRTLQFPGGSDKEGLILARNEARQLSQFLGAALGASVGVKPVLAFPGWSVVCREQGDVAVVSSKTIRTAVLPEGPATLTAEEVRQIALQLDQKCRDVEF